MEKKQKNIIAVLGIVSVLFLGYYFYAQRDEATLSLTESKTEVLFADVQRYSERRQRLDQVSLNTEMFSDPYFRSLVSYGSPVSPRPIGRTNPFDPAMVGI